MKIRLDDAKDRLRAQYERTTCGGLCRTAVAPNGKPAAEYFELCEGIAAEYHGACKWIHCADSDSWDTACGNAHCFIDGGPKENAYKHCPYCGKRLEV